LRRCLLAILLAAALLPAAAQAEPVRIAVFNAGLSRDGPGLLLRDILKGDDPQVVAAAGIIAAVRPDVLLLLGFDHDAENRALTAFRALLRRGVGQAQGLGFPHLYSPPQNGGLPSGLDLDGDGLLRGPADAFGFGEFRGQSGMAILSRLPLDQGAARDFSAVLWRDLAEADLPVHADGTPFPSEQAQAAMRLSSSGHWDVPVTLPDGRVIHLLASYSAPPVFDGPEDINGKRNRDELRFWAQYLGGRRFREAGGQDVVFAGGAYVLLAGLNTDPQDGDGARDVLRGILERGLFRDPEPESSGGAAASARQGGINATQAGDPARDTADWRDDPGPGNLRVDYVLPSPALRTRAAGVFWPAPDQDGGDLVARGQELGIRHRLVWVDLE
jgi:hypothetical protein